MSKGLEALTAIEENFLSKSKTYNSHIVRILNIKTGKMYAPKELTEIVRNELKEHEKLKNLVVKMFGENGLDLETWAHLDKSNTYHIVYTNSYEHLDIPISKEDYDFLGGLYGKETS